VRSTRIVTFLLGAWIAGCLFVDLTALQNLRLAGQMMNTAIPAAAEILQGAPRDKMTDLLHHFASEQYRYYFSVWGWLQLAALLGLAGLLYFATEKRLLPQILCLVIFLLCVFQLAIHPELAYRGQEADFPPGSLSVPAEARHLVLLEIWGGVEVVKLLAGGALALFLFSYKSPRRSRRATDAMTAARAD
jgi:hypothetical protein